MGKTFNLIVQALLLPGVWDSQCGFKLMKGEVAAFLAARQILDGFAVDVDLLFVARRAGVTIKEVPITWINDPDSRVHPLEDSFQMLRDVVRVRIGSSLGAYD